MYMVIATENNVLEEKCHKRVHAIVDSHRKRPCANTPSLEGLSHCSFVDYVSDETNFNIPKSQITGIVKNVGISDQMRENSGPTLGGCNVVSEANKTIRQVKHVKKDDS